MTNKFCSGFITIGDAYAGLNFPECIFIPSPGTPDGLWCDLDEGHEGKHLSRGTHHSMRKWDREPIGYHGVFLMEWTEIYDN